MEHISEILGKQTRTNISRESTDTWSGAEEEARAGPECPVCKGAGIVHPRLPSGETDYSRVVPCNCTRTELDSERRNRLKQYSNLGSLTRFTFDNLMPQGRSGNPLNQQSFTTAFEAARAFANEPKGWLVLIGPSGGGKTHLAAAIANERLKQGQPAFYITAPDLLDHLRSAFNPESEIQYDQFFALVRNAPLLILDDLGTESGTSWAQEKLYQVLNYRYNSRLPTVITVAGFLEGIEGRLSSRLTDPKISNVIPIFAPDYRLQIQPPDGYKPPRQPRRRG